MLALAEGTVVICRSERRPVCRSAAAQVCRLAETGRAIVTARVSVSGASGKRSADSRAAGMGRRNGGRVPTHSGDAHSRNSERSALEHPISKDLRTGS